MHLGGSKRVMRFVLHPNSRWSNSHSASERLPFDFAAAGDTGMPDEYAAREFALGEAASGN